MIPLWAQWLAVGAVVWTALVRALDVVVFSHEALKRRRNARELQLAREEFEQSLKTAMAKRAPEKEMN